MLDSVEVFCVLQAERKMFFDKLHRIILWSGKQFSRALDSPVKVLAQSKGKLNPPRENGQRHKWKGDDLVIEVVDVRWCCWCYHGQSRSQV